jgi:hypothetical protein
MSNLDFRQKVFTSPAFYFIFYTFVFGGLQLLDKNGNRHASWPLALLDGLCFGSIMTLVTRRNQAKYNASTGVNNPKKQVMMHMAVQKGELPKDKASLAAMPAYLESRAKRNQQSRKFSTAFLAFVALSNLVLSVTTKDKAESVLSLFVLGLAYMNYRTTAQQYEKISNMQSRLAKK